MQLLTWDAWLASIPYYEAEKQQETFATQTPPESVLVVDAVDRSRRVDQLVTNGMWNKPTWEGMDQEIRSLGFFSQPIFLRNDTHQLWFWGFWSHKEALLAILKLT